MKKTNQELHPTFSMTDRLYFEKFAIYKRTVSAKFEHPLLKKSVCHKFHIGTLEQYQNPEEFKKRLNDFGHNIDKTDRTEELNSFKVLLKDRQNYFLFEIWDGKKTLPPYYAAMYIRDCFFDPYFEPSKVNNLNWFDYIKSCNEEISGYIYEENLHPSCMFDLFKFFHDFGFAIYEWLNKEHAEYIDEPLDSKSLDEYRRKLERLKEPAMRNYALAVLQSVFQSAYKNREMGQCQFCGRFIDYVKNKRFCSLNAEKRDCGKKARNKRHYQKNKEKIIPKAIRTNHELRAFYKEKNIKK